MQTFTVPQYARQRGVSKVAVTRAMNKGAILIGISSYRKIGRDWVLTARKDYNKKNIKKGLVIQK